MYSLQAFIIEAHSISSVCVGSIKKLIKVQPYPAQQPVKAKPGRAEACLVRAPDNAYSAEWRVPGREVFPHAQNRVSPRQSFTSGPVLLTACLHPLWSQRRAGEIQESSTSIIQRSSVCAEIQRSVASCAGRLLYGNLLWRWGGGQGRVVFQRNPLKLARNVHGCMARLEYTGVIVVSQAEMKQWINSSVMTFKFELNSFCSNLTWESNLTVETALPFPARTERHGRLGSDVLHYKAATGASTPVSDIIHRGLRWSFKTLRVLSTLLGPDSCDNHRIT